VSSLPVPAEVLDRLPTPAYVYDLDEVRRCQASLRAALPEPVRLYYSVKANPHPAVLRTLHRAGWHAEVSSPGELAAALDAGVPAGEVLYTGPGKRDADVLEAVKAGVGWFSADSPYGLEQVAAAAGGAGGEVRCLLRVNDESPVPGQGLTMTGVPSQFGADVGWLLAEPERFTGGTAAPVAGLHLYMGSNMSGEDALLAQFRRSVGTARRLADTGLPVEVLDLGGGFGAPFARAGDVDALRGLRDGLAALLDAEFPGWRSGHPVVAFESGRYLTATCGTLLTRVLDAKRSFGRTVLVLESGINHLGGMSGLRRLPPLRPTLVGPGGPREGEPADAIVAGPLCTPLDTLAWTVGPDLAGAAPGDLVAVPNVGAYGLSASLVAFLGHPLPAEVVVEDGRVTGVSRLSLHRRDPDEV
jgi:diaminopimelate decarboxylase